MEIEALRRVAGKSVRKPLRGAWPPGSAELGSRSSFR